MKFLSPEFISINLPYSHAGLLLLVALWNCSISYKNGLFLHLLPLLNPWLIIKMLSAEDFSIGFTLVDAHLSWPNWFHFLILKEGQLVILIDCMISLSPFLCQKFLSSHRQTLDSLSIECFPSTYDLNGLKKKKKDLNGFKFRINRYLLIADSF